MILQMKKVTNDKKEINNKQNLKVDFKFDSSETNNEAGNSKGSINW